MSEELKQAELESLKARADLLGVTYHPSISPAKLREKIAAHQAGQAQTEDAPAEGEESKYAKQLRLQQEATKLVRVNVMCNNPAKREWAGEIISVGNNAVGTIKKYVPFNTEDGWHIPQFMYQVLKERQCPVFYNDKTKHGVTVRRSKLIKEFNIEVLDPLNAQELQELKIRQAMEAGQAEA
jgi:hypothetical protein